MIGGRPPNTGCAVRSTGHGQRAAARCTGSRDEVRGASSRIAGVLRGRGRRSLLEGFSRAGGILPRRRALGTTIGPTARWPAGAYGVKTWTDGRAAADAAERDAEQCRRAGAGSRYTRPQGSRAWAETRLRARVRTASALRRPVPKSCTSGDRLSLKARRTRDVDPGAFILRQVGRWSSRKVYRPKAVGRAGARPIPGRRSRP